MERMKSSSVVLSLRSSDPHYSDGAEAGRPALLPQGPLPSPPVQSSLWLRLSGLLSDFSEQPRGTVRAKLATSPDPARGSVTGTSPSHTQFGGIQGTPAGPEVKFVNFRMPSFLGNSDEVLGLRQPSIHPLPGLVVWPTSAYRALLNWWVGTLESWMSL